MHSWHFKALWLKASIKWHMLCCVMQIYLLNFYVVHQIWRLKITQTTLIPRWYFWILYLPVRQTTGQIGWLTKFSVEVWIVKQELAYLKHSHQFKRQILSEQCQHKNKIMSALKKKGKVSVTILCATQALVKTN